MLTIPIEDFKGMPYDDSDVINAWSWLRSFIPSRKWEERKLLIEKRISTEFRSTPPFSEPISNGTAITIKDDQIGWYLYLIEMLIKEPYKYEYFQGSRVVPIFKRLGMDILLLKQITGITSKVRKLINQRPSEADAILFEILTALLWARNGWQAEFLEEHKSKKMPDLVARKSNEDWYIECKRQSKTSDYAQAERSKWQIMISHLREVLLEHDMLLEVVFHVELLSLPDTFLKDLLYSKLSFVVQPGKVVSNNQVDVEVSFVDMTAIKNHFQRYSVKNGSPQLAELIGGKPSDNIGFTAGMKASFVKYGAGTANNLYVTDIDSAYGVFWRCDAKEAITAKARDIKKQIFTALEQFHPEHNAVIHIGMETFDGPLVEQERFLKITDTLNRIELNGKKLKWAYCHFFQSYSHSQEVWTLDETVNTISSNPPQEDPPLTSKFLIVPENDGIDNLAHWERPLPYY